MIDRTKQPDIQEVTDIRLPAIQRTTLKNGIPLTIINSAEQDIIRMDFLFNGGYWTQSKKLQCSLTNAMLREGTSKYSSGEIAEKFDYYGSTLELSVFPQFSYITSYSLNKYCFQTLELLESIIKESVFPEKEFQILLNRELQKFQINSTKANILSMRKLCTALYGDEHPMGKTTIEEDYNNITTDDLLLYYKQHYNTNNCHIILSGKVTASIEKYINDFFGNDYFGEKEQLITLPTYPIKTTKEKQIFVEKADAKQSSVKLGMLSIGLHHPDFLKFDILITLFGGYFGSRLMSNIREEKGYTYNIFSGFLHEPDSSPLIITSEVGNEYVKPLIHEVYYEIDRLQNELIGYDELNIACNYMCGSLCRTMETPFTLADVYQMQFMNKLPDDYYQKEIYTIRHIKPEDLRLMAQKYLCKENLKEIISGKKLA